MIQILKRLEIIKSSICIEETEIIQLQVMKLKTFNLDDDIQYIIKNLEDNDLSTAQILIENYLTKHNSEVVYESSEIITFKLELKSLESTLQNLLIQKREYINNIEEFNDEYTLYLGKIIKQILSLKKEMLYKKTIKQQESKEKYQEDIKTFDETKETINELKNTIEELEEALEKIDKDDENYDEIYKVYKKLEEELENIENELLYQEEDLVKTKEFIENEEIKKEFENIKSHSEDFESEYKYIKDKQDLKIPISEEEKKELKELYKNVSRLCLPDIVADKIKEKSHKIMQELNESYSKQDLIEVKKILHSLETSEDFEVSSDIIKDKMLLKEKINEYKENISNLKKELAEIKENETYQTISTLENWNDYFEELKKDLIQEKEKLEKSEKTIIDENENTNNRKENQSEKIDFYDHSFTSNSSSINYMGDGMWINDSDRWW